MARTAPYIAAMCRPRTSSAFGDDGRIVPELLDANIAEFCRCIEKAAGDHGARLVLFPEFALSGYAPVSYEAWVEAGISFPGPEIDRIAQAARAANAYVVVQAAETHPALPDRYFLSAVILTPEGEVGLVHRKNYTLSLRTSPVEIYDRFVQVFGADAFYPVLETPIGNLAVSIAAEVHWPEAIRPLALKGAEVILNPIANAEGVDYLGRAGADIIRPARAFENLVYLGMTNIDGGTAEPAVYDYKGAAIGHAVDDGLFTLATINIGALREFRASGGMNLLAQIQPAILEDIAGLPLWPKNLLADTPATGFEQLMQAEQKAWAAMAGLGRGKLPGQD